MSLTLVPHPDFTPKAITGVTATVQRASPTAVALRYVISGDSNQLLLPAAANGERTDELWRHTCVEVFIRPASGTAYHEFNFAPSTQWAAYGFADYREGMANIDGITTPSIETQHVGDDTVIAVLQECDGLPLLPVRAPWRLAIATVIEEKDGTKSFWALHHQPGKPDFHHVNCFTFELEPMVIA